MKEQIQQKIKKWVDDNVEYSESNADYSKIPQLAQEIVDMVVEEIEARIKELVMELDKGEYPDHIETRIYELKRLRDKLK